jgi:hypothetical protein
MKTYKIAFVIEGSLSSGRDSWDVVEEFEAANNAAANSYAEENYPGREWYVLDGQWNNINA